MTVTAGHFVSRTNNKLFYNNGAALSSPVGGDTSGSRNFYYVSSNTGALTNVVIPDCYYLATGINTINMYVGDTTTKTYNGGGSGTITATSSNTSVATASMSGTTLTITAKAVGSATITMTRSGGTTIKWIVNVRRVTPTLTLSKTTLTAIAGNTYSQIITVTYDGDGALSVASSATAKATASIASKKVTVVAVAAGSATITVSSAQTGKYAAASAKCTVTVQAALYEVSSVASGKYKYQRSLKNSVSAANAGATIKVLANTSEADQITINKNIILNTNGKTLTRKNTSTPSVKVTAGTLTLKGTGTVTGPYNVFWTRGGNIVSSQLTVKSTGTGSTGCAIGNGDSNGTVTVNSGTYSTKQSGLWNASGGTMTVNGGTIQGTGLDGITQNTSVSSTKLIVKGGTISGKNWAIYVNGGTYTKSGSPTLKRGAKGTVYNNGSSY